MDLWGERTRRPKELPYLKLGGVGNVGLDFECDLNFFMFEDELDDVFYYLVIDLTEILSLDISPEDSDERASLKSSVKQSRKKIL